MKKILAIILSVMVFSSYFIQESEAEVSLKKSDEIRCTNIYDKYLKLGDDGFRKRYPAYPIMSKCLSLFDDPNFLSNHSIVQDISPTPIDAKTLSSLKIGNEKFLVKFMMCYDEQKTKYISIISDKENIVGKIKKFSESPCPSFWVISNTSDPLDVQFSWNYENNFKQKTLRDIF